MKRQFGILLAVIIIASLAVAQADVTLAPKVPAATQKVVVVMFDDGWLNQYTTALPILQNFSYKASFAIYPEAMDGQWPDFMSWTQVEALAQSGYDVESHTYSHMDLDNVTTAQLNRELVQSKQVLEQHGIQAGALIYPYGDAVNNDTIKQAAKDAGYLVARGTDDGLVNLADPNLDYYALNAYPILNSTNLPYFEVNLDGVSGSNIAILLYHKISTIDTDAETVTPDNFAQQMAYLHDNGFTVETLSDVFFDITPLPTPSPTVTPTPTPSATPSPTPEPSATPAPTVGPAATTEPTPTAEPTSTPTPTTAPTNTPTSNPTPAATPKVTPTPATSPTATPTGSPSDAPQPLANMLLNPVLLGVVAVCAVCVVIGVILVKKR